VEAPKSGIFVIIPLLAALVVLLVVRQKPNGQIRSKVPQIRRVSAAFEACRLQPVRPAERASRLTSAVSSAKPIAPSPQNLINLHHQLPRSLVDHGFAGSRVAEVMALTTTPLSPTTLVVGDDANGLVASEQRHVKCRTRVDQSRRSL